MLVVLLLFFLVADPTSQTSISIDASGIAAIHQTLAVASQDGHVTVALPFRVRGENLVSSIDGIPVSCTVNQISGTTIIDFVWEGEGTLTLDYYVTDITGKEKDTWYLTLPALSSPVVIFLPEGASVEYTIYEGEFPKVSYEGERLVLEWQELSFPLTIYYSFGTLSAQPADSISPLLLLPFLIIPLVLAIIYNRKKKRRKGVNPSILAVLDERERGIVLFLAERGKMKQAKISKATGIPKTSLSKIMVRLSERNIVTMEKDGNTTLCWLREEIFR